METADRTFYRTLNKVTFVDKCRAEERLEETRNTINRYVNPLGDVRR